MCVFSPLFENFDFVNRVMPLRQCVQVLHRRLLELKTVHPKPTIAWKEVLRPLQHTPAFLFLSRSRARRTTSTSTSRLLFWTNARRNVLVSYGSYSVEWKCHLWRPQAILLLRSPWKKSKWKKLLVGSIYMVEHLFEIKKNVEKAKITIVWQKKIVKITLFGLFDLFMFSLWQPAKKIIG